MDRKVKKEMLEILAALQDILPQAEAEPEIFGQAAGMAAEIKKLCQRQECQKQSFYEEILEGLYGALLAGTQEPREARPEIIKLSLELLQTIEQELRQEKTKKEIVFLPYKASMWDCFESVWRAAAEDKENSNVYVMPIPYAERNPDHTVREWRWEFNQFPEEVPITDYRQVDLAQMHPDVIFIHNPYDGWNGITSVEGDYYSSELKKYTDKLVYIPYFVTDGVHINPELIDTPGVINADVVIVETEEIRQQYIEHYPDPSLPRAEIEKKILALGSPKFDKVINARREDYTLPEAWEKLIQGKRSILYNTSISCLLATKEEYLKKIRNVLREFEKNTAVILWWRPHPLMEATMASLLPDLLEEYHAIVKGYQEAHYGIYDDSADLYRAITWTDAYYGDGSSVVHLYKKTGKPIMIQNINILAEEEETNG